ncbi:hypothetical protein CLIM01_03294 [Colletotrichum limetticola]|uniref:Uncharacterized protein n=1 Tax=Colletotrichum limetticola TaxID=1209924 RepID=A0ABQ9Q6D2_9PEZI|nr:hypothetical protein CLIM01_03294 [Colletotrichum limetticola]
MDHRQWSTNHTQTTGRLGVLGQIKGSLTSVDCRYLCAKLEWPPPASALDEDIRTAAARPPCRKYACE